MSVVRILVVSAVFLGVASHSAAQVLPANEGVCDELMWATPGLFGLCVAFCEAQDCEPDFSQADPFENCKPSSPKLLDLYDKKRQPGDPVMPCIAPAPNCPCWTQAELDGLRFPTASDSSAECLKDLIAGQSTNFDQWVMERPDDPFYFAGAQSAEDRAGLGPRCAFVDLCDDGSCGGVFRILFMNLAEFVTCEAQLNQAGAERGFECFLE